MKIILIIILVVAALFTVHTHPEEEYTYGVYEMTFSSELISNDSVGNEWQMSYSCDGRNITNGEQWLVSLDKPQTAVIDITATEKDKIPDVGTGTISVTLNGDSETKTLITVTETGGNNEGKEAQWEITCKVKLIKMN